MSLPSDMYGTRWPLPGQARFEGHAFPDFPSLPSRALAALRHGWQKLFLWDSWSCCLAFWCGRW